MNIDQIQALKKPLLNDEERTTVFFDLLPEIAFGDFLNELSASCRFNDEAQEMLEAYLTYLRKPTIRFDNDLFDDTFTSFNNEFHKFNSFLESNFFVENNLYVLHPILKRSEPEHFNEKKSELKKLCQSLADQYIKLVHVFASINPPKHSPASDPTYVNGKVRYGDEYYVPTSKHQKKILDTLWEFRVKKIKDAEGYQIGALAVQLDMTDSASDVTSKMRESIRQTLKDFSDYLQKKRKFPIKILVKDGLVYLIVG